MIEFCVRQRMIIEDHLASCKQCKESEQSAQENGITKKEPCKGFLVQLRLHLQDCIQCQKAHEEYKKSILPNQTAVVFFRIIKSMLRLT